MNDNNDVSSLFSIRGKIALVTGGSRGIGLMIARGYVEAGATVYISSRTAEVCDAVAEELSAIGSCISLPTDLSTMEGVDHLVREISEREEKLHILVNNAGAAWGEPIETFPEEGFDKITDLNLKSLFFLTRDLLPMLEKAATPDDPARVINIGSIDGLRVPFVPNFLLRRGQGGGPPPDPDAGRPPRRPKDHGQRGGARVLPEQDDQAPARKLPRDIRKGLPARPDRRTGGHGRHRRLPRLPRGLLHQRRRHSRRWGT